jgi:hypothetical protein
MGSWPDQRRSKGGPKAVQMSSARPRPAGSRCRGRSRICPRPRGPRASPRSARLAGGRSRSARESHGREAPLASRVSPAVAAAHVADHAEQGHVSELGKQPLAREGHVPEPLKSLEGRLHLGDASWGKRRVVSATRAGRGREAPPPKAPRRDRPMKRIDDTSRLQSCVALSRASGS